MLEHFPLALVSRATDEQSKKILVAPTFFTSEYSFLQNLVFSNKHSSWQIGFSFGIGEDSSQSGKRS
jgi:hypothetical protein